MGCGMSDLDNADKVEQIWEQVMDAIEPKNMDGAQAVDFLEDLASRCEMQVMAIQEDGE